MSQSPIEVCDNVIEELNDILKEYGESDDYRFVEAIDDLRCRIESWKGRPDMKSYRTYETCHKHFSCPDGEECWYLSADYYWDCGNGASRLFDEYIRGKNDGSHIATLKAYDKFFDEMKNEDFDNLGYIDMDSIEAIYTRLYSAAQENENEI